MPAAKVVLDPGIDPLASTALMITDGLGTMLGAVCGSPFPTTVYISHPGYKRINARCGYVLGLV